MRGSVAARGLFAGLAGLVLLGLAAAWAALAPLPVLARERVLAIPRGTGPGTVPGFPSRVDLTLGLQDVLVLQNDDDRPQVVASIEVPPRTRLTIPFTRPTDFELACSVHPSGKLTVRAREAPAAGWARLRWRLGRLMRA